MPSWPSGYGSHSVSDHTEIRSSRGHHRKIQYLLEIFLDNLNKNKDPDFGSLSVCMEWERYRLCFWISRIQVGLCFFFKKLGNNVFAFLTEVTFRKKSIQNNINGLHTYIFAHFQEKITTELLQFFSEFSTIVENSLDEKRNRITNYNKKFFRIGFTKLMN